MFIDLMEDYWIKNILGNDEYTKPLEVITENVLRLPKGILKNQIIIKGQEYPLKKATYKEKDVRADVYAFLGEDTILNLEAYKTFDKEKLRKSNVYLCRGYSSQLKKSMPYRKMKKFIQINLVDHVSKGVLQEKLVQRYFLEEQGYPLTDDIQIYYIRLDLLDKLNYNVGISDEEFLDILRYLKTTSKNERQILRERWVTIMTMDEYMNALLSDEVMNEERGMFKKAREYGREEGISQGINIGESRGIDFVAKNLLKDGKKISYISKVTGLTEEEIRKLQEKLRYNQDSRKKVENEKRIFK
mgnify:CR=1 FL=1